MSSGSPQSHQPPTPTVVEDADSGGEQKEDTLNDQANRGNGDPFVRECGDTVAVSVTVSEEQSDDGQPFDGTGKQPVWLIEEEPVTISSETLAQKESYSGVTRDRDDVLSHQEPPSPEDELMPEASKWKSVAEAPNTTDEKDAREDTDSESSDEEVAAAPMTVLSREQKKLAARNDPGIKTKVGTVEPWECSRCTVLHEGPDASAGSCLCCGAFRKRGRVPKKSSPRSHAKPSAAQKLRTTLTSPPLKSPPPPESPPSNPTEENSNVSLSSSSTSSSASKHMQSTDSSVPLVPFPVEASSNLDSPTLPVTVLNSTSAKPESSKPPSTEAVLKIHASPIKEVPYPTKSSSASTGLKISPPLPPPPPQASPLVSMDIKSKPKVKPTQSEVKAKPKSLYAGAKLKMNPSTPSSSSSSSTSAPTRTSVATPFANSKCECCEALHPGSFGSGRFCGLACRSRFNGRQSARRKVESSQGTTMGQGPAAKKKAKSEASKAPVAVLKAKAAVKLPEAPKAPKGKQLPDEPQPKPEPSVESSFSLESGEEEEEEEEGDRNGSEDSEEEEEEEEEAEEMAPRQSLQQQFAQLQQLAQQQITRDSGYGESGGGDTGDWEDSTRGGGRRRLVRTAAVLAVAKSADQAERASKNYLSPLLCIDASSASAASEHSKSSPQNGSPQVPSQTASPSTDRQGPAINAEAKPEKSTPDTSSVPLLTNASELTSKAPSSSSDLSSSQSRSSASTTTAKNNIRDRANFSLNPASRSARRGATSHLTERQQIALALQLSDGGGSTESSSENRTSAQGTKGVSNEPSTSSSSDGGGEGGGSSSQNSKNSNSQSRGVVALNGNQARTGGSRSMRDGATPMAAQTRKTIASTNNNRRDGRKVGGGGGDTCAPTPAASADRTAFRRGRNPPGGGSSGSLAAGRGTVQQQFKELQERASNKRPILGSTTGLSSRIGSAFQATMPPWPPPSPMPTTPAATSRSETGTKSKTIGAAAETVDAEAREGSNVNKYSGVDSLREVKGNVGNSDDRSEGVEGEGNSLQKKMPVAKIETTVAVVAKEKEGATNEESGRDPKGGVQSTATAAMAPVVGVAVLATEGGDADACDATENAEVANMAIFPSVGVDAGEAWAVLPSLPSTEILCEDCEVPHSGAFGSGRFCSIACRSRFNGKKSRRVEASLTSVMSSSGLAARSLSQPMSHKKPTSSASAVSLSLSAVVAGEGGGGSAACQKTVEEVAAEEALVAAQWYADFDDLKPLSSDTLLALEAGSGATIQHAFPPPAGYEARAVMGLRQQVTPWSSAERQSFARLSCLHLKGLFAVSKKMPLHCHPSFSAAIRRADLADGAVPSTAPLSSSLQPSSLSTLTAGTATHDVANEEAQTSRRRRSHGECVQYYYRVMKRASKRRDAEADVADLVLGPPTRPHDDDSDGDGSSRCGSNKRRLEQNGPSGLVAVFGGNGDVGYQPLKRRLKLARRVSSSATAAAPAREGGGPSEVDEAAVLAAATAAADSVLGGVGCGGSGGVSSKKLSVGSDGVKSSSFCSRCFCDEAGGVLLRCSQCSRSFHVECHPPTSSSSAAAIAAASTEASTSCKKKRGDLKEEDVEEGGVRGEEGEEVEENNKLVAVEWSCGACEKRAEKKRKSEDKRRAVEEKKLLDYKKQADAKRARRDNRSLTAQASAAVATRAEAVGAGDSSKMAAVSMASAASVASSSSVPLSSLSGGGDAEGSLDGTSSLAPLGSLTRRLGHCRDEQASSSSLSRTMMRALVPRSGEGGRGDEGEGKCATGASAGDSGDLTITSTPIGAGYGQRGCGSERAGGVRSGGIEGFGLSPVSAAASSSSFSSSSSSAHHIFLGVSWEPASQAWRASVVLPAPPPPLSSSSSTSGVDSSGGESSGGGGKGASGQGVAAAGVLPTRQDGGLHARREGAAAAHDALVVGLGLTGQVPLNFPEHLPTYLQAVSAAQRQASSSTSSPSRSESSSSLTLPAECTSHAAPSFAPRGTKRVLGIVDNSSAEEVSFPGGFASGHQNPPRFAEEHYSGGQGRAVNARAYETALGYGNGHHLYMAQLQEEEEEEQQRNQEVESELAKYQGIMHRLHQHK